MTQYWQSRVHLLVLLGFVLSLSGCQRLPHVNEVSERQPHRWLVSDALATTIPFTTSDDTPSIPPPPAADSLAHWQRPADTWITIELDAIKRDYPAPPQAARALALLSIGMNDALVVAEAVRRTGHEVSDDGVLAAAAVRILSYCHPTLASSFIANASVARWAGAWRGAATAVGIANGEAIGAASADVVLTHARNDGADVLSGSSPLRQEALAPGQWAPTPPDYWSPLLPEWGKVTTIVIGDPASVRAPPPPMWNAAKMEAERHAFATVQAQLTENDRALAKKWNGGMGTVTPPGQWNEIALTLVQRHNLNPHQTASVFAALNVAQHDAFVAVWDTKYTYNVARPIQWMATIQPTWSPTIKTPPFPSYPSGHSTTSGAASIVLAALFPADASHLAQETADASWSRVVGGIHWITDCDQGLLMGMEVGKAVLARLGLHKTLELPAHPTVVPDNDGSYPNSQGYPTSTSYPAPARG